MSLDTPVRRASRSRARFSSSGNSGTRPRIGRRVAAVLLLMLLAGSLLTSIPALRPVASTIRHIRPVWIAAATALELASCVSFVILFRLFFDRLAPRDTRALAWTEMASGALLPGGGAGGLAIGGWLIHLAGAPTNWIIRRSGGLFFLTSAVNSATLITAGLLLAAGIPGPHTFTLTLLPALAAAGATIAVAALPRVIRSRPQVARVVGGIAAGIHEAEQTTFGQPSWRLAGAVGYLGFDMAVLWITLHAVGEPLSIPALVLAYNIGYLANALPIPGGIGVLDAGLAGALLLYGASPAHVTAAVLVYHTIALWIPGLGGTLAYLRLRPRLVSPPAASVNPLSVCDHRSPITERNSMNAQTLILRPIRHGWAIDLTGGQHLARFRGPGARARALRYVTRVGNARKTPPATQKPRPFSPEAMC